MNNNILKLMIADIVEKNNDTVSLIETEFSKYEVYPMSDLEDLVGEINDLEKDVVYSNEFDYSDEWFNKRFASGEKCEINSLTDSQYNDFIANNKNGILESYKTIENSGYGMYNEIEIREEILRHNANHIEKQDELDEVENIIYEDISLETIAEVLIDVKVQDLFDSFSYYGTWDVLIFNGVSYLVDR